jgi:hypothetical protein
MLEALISEKRTWKNSTRCLPDLPADGYNRQIQTEVDQGARRRAEQIRASRAKKTPDRRGPKQTEELAELTQLRGDSRHTVKTDTDKSDTGRQFKQEVK